MTKTPSPAPWTITDRFARAARFLALSNPSTRTSLAWGSLINLGLAVVLTFAFYWAFYFAVTFVDNPVTRIQMIAERLPEIRVTSELRTTKNESGAAEGISAQPETAIATAITKLCEPHERAAIRLQRGEAFDLVAVITPSATCMDAPSCDLLDKEVCRIPVMRLERNVLGVLTPVMETPVQAAARRYEAFVTSNETLIQCTTSQRRTDAERSLCAQTTTFEKHYGRLLDSAGFVALRKLNGPFQVLSVLAGFLLTVIAVRHSHAMRVSHDDALQMKVGEQVCLPWHAATTPAQAFQSWNTFLGESGDGVTGQELVDASPYLAAHGAAITALHFGHDAYEAVDRMIESFQRKAEIAGGLARYLVYAIPTFGFLGTVVGMGHAMRLTSVAQSGDPAEQAYARAVLGDHVVVAFDTTMVGLIASLVALALLYFFGQVTESNIERVRQAVHRSMGSGQLKALATKAHQHSLAASAGRAAAAASLQPLITIRSPARASQTGAWSSSRVGLVAFVVFGALAVGTLVVLEVYGISVADVVRFLRGVAHGQDTVTGG